MILTSSVQSMTWSELRGALAIRRGATNHSAALEPHENKIHGLCGSLLVFDRSSKENEDNPKVKFCHKTIADFLKQDPDDLFLDISSCPNPAKLRAFFVDPTNAATQIGLDCLTLLQYDCYKQLENVKTVLEDNMLANAFLKYAAAFWFLHLEEGNQTQEVYLAIEKFMQSPNFWTCVAVQSHIVPYVFGRYAETAPGCYQMGLRRANLCEQDSFGVPLPTWLEEYAQKSADLDSDFCSFISDWHEVLAFKPGALSQCVRLNSAKSKLRTNPHQPETMRVWRATDKMNLTNLSDIFINSVYLSEGKLFAQMISCHESASKDQWRYHQVSAFSKSIEITAPVNINFSSIKKSGQCNNFQINKVDGNLRFMAFDEENLQFKCSSGDSWDVSATPDTFQSAKPGYRWRVVWKDAQTTEHGLMTVFHVSEEMIKAESVDECESDDYSDSDSDSSSDSNSESGSDSETSVSHSNDSGYEENQDKKQCSKGHIRDWLLVVLDPRRPLWIPISLDDRQRGGIAYAIHPSLPLLLCTAKGQNIHADLKTGKWDTWRGFSNLEDVETRAFSRRRRFQYYL